MKLPRKVIKGRFLEENLSQPDIRFIVTTLASRPAQADGLLKLLSDEGSRTSILDNPALLQAARVPTLPCSPQLFFYLVVRQSLLQAALPLPQLAAFLSEALVAFPPAPRPGVHTTDYEEALKNAKDYEWFVLAVEVANRALILSAIYGEDIYKAKKTYAVASLNRYENIGRNHYFSASRHSLAKEFQLKEILSLLAENFVKVRTALSSIKDAYRTTVAGRA